MTFFRELWRMQQITRKEALERWPMAEKALGGDMSVSEALVGPTPHPEPSDRSSSQPEPSTHACGDWAGAHLRAFGLKRGEGDD